MSKPLRIISTLEGNKFYLIRGTKKQQVKMLQKFKEYLFFTQINALVGTDRNNNEVYELDILKNQQGELLMIAHELMYPKEIEATKHKLPSLQIQPSKKDIDLKEYEIIGNAYEYMPKIILQTTQN